MSIVAAATSLHSSVGTRGGRFAAADGLRTRPTFFAPIEPFRERRSRERRQLPLAMNAEQAFESAPQDRLPVRPIRERGEAAGVEAAEAIGIAEDAFAEADAVALRLHELRAHQQPREVDRE